MKIDSDMEIGGTLKCVSLATPSLSRAESVVQRNLFIVFFKKINTETHCIFKSTRKLRCARYRWSSKRVATANTYFNVMEVPTRCQSCTTRWHPGIKHSNSCRDTNKKIGVKLASPSVSNVKMERTQHRLDIIHSLRTFSKNRMLL